MNKATENFSCGKSDNNITDIVLNAEEPLRFADFFCGIGGFHIGAANLGMKCVFASDIDNNARDAYEANFGIRPVGDIVNVRADQVPDHDLLFAGFPCQPFSIIGKRNGFADPRGTLFFELLRIIKEKMPAGFVLENVKQLATASHGSVIERILADLREVGYEVDYNILNALDFGLPQKRERTIIVGTTSNFKAFKWPGGGVPVKPLSAILEKKPSDSVYVSRRIRRKRHEAHTPKETPSIWHENKSGNISSYPYSCALRAGASHNYLLVDGKRRLTTRETLRLQGFPDSYKIVCAQSQIKKQTGNAVAVPVAQAVIKEIASVVNMIRIAGQSRKTA